MKILTVSDEIENNFLNYKRLTAICRDVELILACGDLAPSYLEYLVNVLNIPLYYVFGNHDTKTDQTFARGCICIDEKSVKFKNLLIAGLSGSIKYSTGDFMFTEAGMHKKIAKLFPHILMNRIRHGRYMDILITHSPVAGIHENNDPVHKGFNALRAFIKHYRPVLHIHGHTMVVKEQYKTQYKETTIINTNNYKILDI